MIMAIKPTVPKLGKTTNQAKVAAKPTRSLPTGTTVGKPGAVSKATKPMGGKKGGC